MPQPVHFEIAGTNPEALVAFYRDIFGWRIEPWGGGEFPYWTITTAELDRGPGEWRTGPGIDGGLTARQGEAPGPDAPINGFVIVVDVPDCDGYVQKVTDAGGSVAMPAQDMAGIGRVAYLKDPDGNLFGIIQPPQT
ncbi:MAG: VOC family protein [Actinomycetota bacterium]